MSYEGLRLNVQRARAPSPAAPKPAASTSAPAPKGVWERLHTDKQVSQAVSAVQAAERQRIAAVFASEASKGRERLAASLLTAPEGWSASAIIAHLPTFAAAMNAKGNAEIDAAWDRAAAKVQDAVQPDTAPADRSGSSADSAWDRAYRSAGK